MKTENDVKGEEPPKKVLFVATVVKMHIIPFHVPYLKMLKEMGWKTAVAARNDYDKAEDCHIPFCDAYYNIPFERLPWKRSNIAAYKALKQLIRNGKYDLIHCNTPVGGLLARLASIQSRRRGTKVIYTAHGFHFYKGAPLVCWLIYFPIERALAHVTDVLITMNQEDYRRAKKFRAEKVCCLPGVGLDRKKFCGKEGVRQEKRRELGMTEDDFILLSVGELSVRKNHSVVIKALARMKALPEFARFHYMICGQGAQRAELEHLADKLGVAAHVHFLGFRGDIAELLSCSDLFLFMSLQEGLPVALMEAMASGLPVICSGIRGNLDLVKDGVNGCIADNTASGVADAIIELYACKEKRDKYSMAAKEQVKDYGLDRTLERMRGIYEEAIDGKSGVLRKKL